MFWHGRHEKSTRLTAGEHFNYVSHDFMSMTDFIKWSNQQENEENYQMKRKLQCGVKMHQLLVVSGLPKSSLVMIVNNDLY